MGEAIEPSKNLELLLRGILDLPEEQRLELFKKVDETSTPPVAYQM